ncbi:hypothetical protein [Microbacterium sp. 3J1]|uniref:hypothetical protein n=1 Tax=Microbacterium sp. 3J1 TaxID=861269 RepID=UPI000A6C18F6|nr:hypothetical protein [Microbacterium sp. 3J1]
MTDQESPSEAPSKRRWWWIGGAAAAAIAVIIAIGIATGWGGGTAPTPEGSAPATSASGSPSPSPSASDSGTPAPEEDAEEVPPTEARPTAPPVGLDQPAAPAEDVRVSLESIDAITGQASVPGEVQGPALQIAVNVENLSSEETLTDTMIVNVYYGPERTPANILVRPREDLPVSIAAGETGKGLYAFSVPEAARGQVVVEVDLSLDLPVVLFEGAVS